jgi:hypothetical protein
MMVFKGNDILRRFQAKPGIGPGISRGILMSLVVVFWVGSLTLAGCQQNTSSGLTEGSIVTEPTPAPDSTPESANDAPSAGTEPEPTTDDSATEEPTTVASAPEPNISPGPVPEPTTPETEPVDDNAALQGSALPQPYLKQWEPSSNVLMTFGTMTITPDQVQWDSGQTSAYTVVGTDNGYLLKLASNPKFYDTNHPYIRLIPETDENGAMDSLAVAFYDNESTAQSDSYMMYGSYFVR